VEQKTTFIHPLLRKVEQKTTFIHPHFIAIVESVKAKQEPNSNTHFTK
jgi:hypothetical protein